MLERNYGAKVVNSSSSTSSTSTSTVPRVRVEGPSPRSPSSAEKTTSKYSTAEPLKSSKILEEEANASAEKLKSLYSPESSPLLAERKNPLVSLSSHQHREYCIPSSL
ncbi:hypothetical protein TYRP_005784 [Tyrophagus putrescentiae]|nr:hypothetical protein TYRP_005784 [Tyrophagus putrescentiae]